MSHTITNADRTLRATTMVILNVAAIGAFVPVTPELTFAAAIGAMYFGMTAIIGMDPVRSAWLSLSNSTQAERVSWSNAVPS